MNITAEQCRAGRALLGWTQDQLATNANVSRATIADFENNSREPIKNNLRSISDCMFAAGLEFIPEEGGAGVGLRFREPKLEHVKSIQNDTLHGRVSVRMRYAGEPFICNISYEALEDGFGIDSMTGDDRKLAAAISHHFHTILAVAERLAPGGIVHGELLITSENLEAA